MPVDPGACWPTGEPTRFVEVNRYPLAYVEAGTGPALLLIHGSISDYRAWIHQLGVFSGSHRTIAVSLRHCFPEHWNGVGGDFTVEQHADDLAAFISVKEIGAVHVVGHSRGGAVAISLALRHPQFVRTLVLADPGGLESLLPDTPEGRHMAGETEQMFARLSRDLATGDAEAAAREFVDSLGGPGTWSRRSPEQRQILLDNIHTGPACAQRPRLTRADVASLDLPILPLTGAKSPPRYALILEAMRTANRRVSDIVTIESAAHAMNRDNALAFNAAVLDFLARHGSS